MPTSPTLQEQARAIDLSVVIVNYNVHYFLEQCLKSVLAASQRLRVEIFVVDNASVDASLSMLKQFAEVEVIANTENVGFAKANNQAIRKARGKYILLLNPDTLVPESCFDKCYAFAEANSQVGCIGARMIDGRGEFLPESKRGFPSAWVSFTKMSGLGKLAPQSQRFNRYYLGHLPEHQTNVVDVLPGAFMWLRAAILPAVNGGLDEDYFMYGEDIDLSYLIQKAGLQNVYFPEVTILHYKGESTRKQSWTYVRSFYQAMAIFAEKHVHSAHHGLQKWVFRAAIYARAALAVVLNYLHAIAVPLLDSVALAFTFVGIKHLWASYYFQNPDYYPATYETINVPLYTSLLLLGQILFGGYDKPYRIPAAMRGAAGGTVLLLIAYALLPVDYRTSRAIILLVGLVSMFVLHPVIRIVWSWINPQEVSFTAEKAGRDRRLLIIGDASEAEHVLRLLGQAGIARAYVGRVAHVQDNQADALGSIDNLSALVDAYSIDEVIISMNGISHRQAIDWIEALGGRVEVRTLAAGGQAIVGSPARNSPGSAYTVGAQYRLHEASARRQKRLFDLAVASLVLILFPFSVLAVRSFEVLKNAFWVLIGSATWVGYTPRGGQVLGMPSLRPCVLPQGVGLHLPPGVDIQRLNDLYARNYSVSRDLRYLIGNYRFMGQSLVAIRKLSPPRWPVRPAQIADYPD